jgi:hypothetical protein
MHPPRWPSTSSAWASPRAGPCPASPSLASRNRMERNVSPRSRAADFLVPPACSSASRRNRRSTLSRYAWRSIPPGGITRAASGTAWSTPRTWYGSTSAAICEPSARVTAARWRSAARARCPASRSSGGGRRPPSREGGPGGRPRRCQADDLADGRAGPHHPRDGPRGRLARGSRGLQGQQRKTWGDTVQVMDCDPALEEELSNLDQEQRNWVEEQLALRARAERLAQRLGLDPDDVFHILRHLKRSPRERLLLGLRHGRFFGTAQPR